MQHYVCSDRSYGCLKEAAGQEWPAMLEFTSRKTEVDKLAVDTARMCITIECVFRY